MKAYYVYMMTNRGGTTLYIGVTNSLVRRVVQHRNREIDGFTQQYNLNRLVYFEAYGDIRDAIRREKQLKGWSRRKKEALINGMNPERDDLAVRILGLEPADRLPWKAKARGDPSTPLRSAQDDKEGDATAQDDKEGNATAQDDGMGDAGNGNGRQGWFLSSFDSAEGSVWAFVDEKGLGLL